MSKKKTERIMFEFPDMTEEKLNDLIDSMQTFLDFGKIKCDSISRVTDCEIVRPSGQVLMA